MKLCYNVVLFLRCGALAQLGERDAGSVEVSGSNPLCSTILRQNPKSLKNGSVAQLVEHHLDMVVVVGSSPIGATIFLHKISAKKSNLKFPLLSADRVQKGVVDFYPFFVLHA